MRLHHPPVEIEWQVLKSWIFDHPPSFFTDSLSELRSKVAALARETNAYRPVQKRIRNLEFKYLTDESDTVTEVHVYFEGYKKKSIPLLKLRGSHAA